MLLNPFIQYPFCLLQVVMPKLGWRWLLAFSSVPSSLLLLCYSFTIESPRYLCAKGRREEALLILEKISRINGTKLPPGMLVSDREVAVEANCSASEDRHLLSPKAADESVKSKSVQPATGWFSSLTMLLSPELARSTLLLWTVFFGNAFSYYGLVLLTTQLNSGKNKCFTSGVQSETPEGVNYQDVLITSFAGMTSCSN